MPTESFRSRLLLLAAAALFSTGGAAIKAISLGAWQVASFRSGIAALVLFAVMPEARRWSWRIVPVAAAYAATLVAFVVANRLTTAADAIFLQSSAPLYFLLLSPLLLHERIHRADILFMATVLAGVSLFFIGSESAVATAPDPRRGNIVALVSGLTYALMLAGLRWLSRRGRANPLAATALGNAFACIVALPFALPVATISMPDVAVLCYLGFFQIGLAYLLLTRGIGKVPAMEATTLLMVEPALSPVWSWIAHHERPAAWSLAGGGLIIGATLINTWRRPREQ